MGMGYLPQEESIFRRMTVEQNIMAILETQPLNRKERKHRCEELLTQFGIDHVGKQLALTLSGGEKRRLHLLSVLFLNPNFLILDEPTNDLDLQTLRTLEEFLLDYPGCILIVSHDRYFMDRMVDHLFAFEGNGVIKDYPGNYSQYREALANEKFTGHEMKEIKVAELEVKPVEKKPAAANAKLSFKEKHEFETIEKEMPLLQKEKTELETKMNDGLLGFEDLQKAAARVGEIVSLLDEKEMRWLELSERI